MNKNIVFFGASGGLMLATVSPLLEDGNNLILQYHNNRSTLEDFIQNLSPDFRDRIRIDECDVRDECSVRSLLDKAKEVLGQIDVLIYASGITRNSVTWKMDSFDWTQVIETNLTGCFYAVKHSLPGMREKGFGRIVIVSSVVPQMGVPGTVAYAASKAGLFGLTRTVAKEVADRNITVNALALGYFDKGMISQVPGTVLDSIINTIPKRKLGNYLNVVGCLRFLISDDTDYVTGQILNINGGLV